MVAKSTPAACRPKTLGLLKAHAHLHTCYCVSTQQYTCNALGCNDTPTSALSQSLSRFHHLHILHSLFPLHPFLLHFIVCTICLHFTHTSPPAQPVLTLLHSFSLHSTSPAQSVFSTCTIRFHSSIGRAP